MKQKFSALFVLMTVLFIVCLIASNLFAIKLFELWDIVLPGAVLIFPISYILNDCIAEVWGYRKARFVIWTAFSMNVFVVVVGQIVVYLPEAGFWQGGEHFNYVFNLAPRVAIASLLAFLVGSNMNAFVMSKMKAQSMGKGFSIRAIISSIIGEFIDSLIFMPIVFWGAGMPVLIKMMFIQVSVKVGYEILVLPLTARFVRMVKRIEGEDIIDKNISYNPFRISDM